MWLNDSEADQQPRARIDLTPMIGVLAALLALFALAIPGTQRIPVAMPSESGDWFAPLPRDFDVRVARDGALTVEALPMTASEFDWFVASAQIGNRPPIFHLRFASHTRYQAMASLLETLQRHDVRYFDFEDDDAR